jgi:hypothetical protein
MCYLLHIEQMLQVSVKKQEVNQVRVENIKEDIEIDLDI